GVVFFFSSRRRHTRSKRDWSSDVCSSDLALGQTLGGGIDGDEAARVQRLVRALLDQLVVLDLHLERPAAIRLDFPVHDQELAALEDARQVRLVEPRAAQEAARVADHDGQGHARAPTRRRADPRDGPRARARVAHGEATEGEDLAAILVAAREVLAERVLDGDEPELGQEFCALRADAGKRLEARAGPRRGRGLGRRPERWWA